jgi:hypothetical protein
MAKMTTLDLQAQVTSSRTDALAAMSAINLSAERAKAMDQGNGSRQWIKAMDQGDGL